MFHSILQKRLTSYLKNGLQNAPKPFSSNINFHTNRPILHSAINPFRSRTSYKYFSYSRHTFGPRSSTWHNYNRHYGNTNWNRLKAPAIFTIGFCGATTILVPYLFDYTPLGAMKRNPMTLIYSIIAINGAVFLMWKSPQFLPMLSKYGLLVKDKLYSNWSLIGAAFSHQDFIHLMFNMTVLHSFGSTLCGMLGPANFLILYLNSAVLSSFISIAIPVLTRSSLAIGSLGASGAIFSVIGTFAYLLPKAPVAFFFIPIPGGAWFAFLAATAFSVAGVFFRFGTYDHAAHLGGSLVGMVYGWWYQRKRRERMNRVRRYGF